MKPVILALCCALALGACRDDSGSKRPKPVAMTPEALGHYCQMNLTEHPGPKAQVHLEGVTAPLFFSQVRDAIAYERMPEQSHAVRAIYVSDMAQAMSWEDPGIDNWAPAEKAFYVAGSRKAGGMGAAEIIPFSDAEAARRFTAEHGGEVIAWADIPDSMVLAPVELSVDRDGNFVPPGAGSGAVQ